MSCPSPEEFIKLRAEGWSIQAIAHHWHFATRLSVYRRVARWRAQGRLDNYSGEFVTNGRRRTWNGHIVKA